MKKALLIFSIIFCVMTTFAQSSFYVYKTDGSTTEYLINEVDSISFVAPAPTPGIENGYEWVDLGLSVNWATCNVGANKPEESGNYYAWGETTPKITYNSSTYTYTSNPSTLPLNKDAASVNMGGSWRMPTKAELDELRTECTWTWTYDYNGTGVAGGIVISKINGNSIFLPAAGCRFDSGLSSAGSYGYYWSSSLYSYYSDNVCYLSFYSGGVSWGSDDYRYVGRSVRGVCP